MIYLFTHKGWSVYQCKTDEGDLYYTFVHSKREMWWWWSWREMRDLIDKGLI